MTEKFKNRFRIKSVRLPGYDYSRSAMYFVTICTKKRIPFFGDLIAENQMANSSDNVILNQTGLIARGCWNDLPHHFPNIELDEFVVMPDHIHGIIIIHGLPVTNPPVETLHATSLQEYQQQFSTVNMSAISPKTGSLPVIIRSFKSAVTKHAQKINRRFAWQPRFHDHIIRNMNEFERIRKYIRNYPLAQ